MNRFNSLKQMEHFDAQNLKKRKQWKKEKIIPFTTFQDTSNITKHIEILISGT